MVEKFLDVFPKDLPGFPVDRETKFYIDLVPRAQCVSIMLYRMVPAELTELKM